MTKPKRREAMFTMREIARAWNESVALREGLIFPWSGGGTAKDFRTELRRIAKARARKRRRG